MTAAKKKAPARKRQPAKKAATRAQAAVDDDAREYADNLDLAATEPPKDGPASPEAGPFAPLEALYPKGTPLWRHKTASGALVVFPSIKHFYPKLTKAFWWKLYQLDTTFQAFEWMRFVGVPEGLQERVVNLPTAEYDALFDAWFEDGGGINTGE